MMTIFRSSPNLNVLKPHSRALRLKLLNEDGSQLIELAYVLPLLFLVFAAAVDFSRAYFVDMEVSSSAEAGALYGLQHPSDLSGMQAAATLNSPDLHNLVSVASYGAECADGTSPVAQPSPPPNCADNVVQYVEVDTTSVYHPIIPYPGIAAMFTLTAKSRMRAGF